MEHVPLFLLWKDQDYAMSTQWNRRNYRKNQTVIPTLSTPIWERCDKAGKPLPQTDEGR
jgi:hypothetical protein